MGDVVEVSARAATFAHADAIEVEDTLVATLRFAGGGLATLSASTALTPGRGSQLRITGRTGATVGFIEYPEGTEAVTDLWAVQGQLIAAPSYPAGILADPSLPEINAGLAPFQAALIDDFVRAVRTGSPPAVTGRTRSDRWASSPRSTRPRRPARPSPFLPSTVERTDPDERRADAG
ncbi:MAG: hypothetical protein ACJ71Y_21770, partial [Blastococcus sp.]